jgi:hypothetical protein
MSTGWGNYSPDFSKGINMQGKSLFEYPYLVAIVILIIGGPTLGLGTGAVLSAWFCACLSEECKFG